LWKPAVDREVILTLGYATLLTAIACGLAAWARRIDTTSAKSSHTWPQSEAAQLRRGLALAILVLASVLLTAQMVRHRQASEAGGLAGALLIDSICGWRSLKAFRFAGSRIR
jgi:heme A synthase